MSHSSTYENFLAACHKDGCPLCRVGHEADVRLLDRFFYEQVNDYYVRTKLRASLGFCADHARVAMDEMQGKALGLAIVYDDMLRLSLEQMGQRGGIQPQPGKCLVCENRLDGEKWVLSDLAKHILEESTRSALQTSSGFCIPHLRLALEHLRAPEKRNILLEIQREKMEGLRAELAEYIRKNDFRFIDEAPGSEKDSWRRAVEMLVGRSK
jgi:hypothetical protein